MPVIIFYYPLNTRYEFTICQIVSAILEEKISILCLPSGKESLIL